jgi:DtxR family Mn-dependent transcriptional regulator
MTKTENTKLTASLEDYLEAIYTVVQEKQAALPKDIRKLLDVGRSSVSGALKALSNRNLINHESYGVITLTDQGTDIARKIVRRHEALKNFFIKVLAVDDVEADKTACLMEHAISATVLGKLIDFVAFVESCPRGGEKWIKGFSHYCENDKATGNCEKCVELVLNEVKGKKMNNETHNKCVELQTLKHINPGQKVVVEKIEGTGGIRQRLMDMGITKNVIINVEKVAPFGDPMDINIKGYHLTLRKEEADCILVRPL